MDISKQQRALVEDIAWDATVGAGNDSEIVNYGLLEARLGRPASGAERTVFGAHWMRCLQDMAQP